MTQDELHKICHYDMNTGILTWAEFRNAKALKNSPVGCLNSKGYLVTNIKNKNYFVHRLIWLYVYGEIPKIVDHINGIKNDNRLVNLRNCTIAESAKNKGLFVNNKTGYKGVSFCNRAKKYQVSCKVNGIKKWLGYFTDPKLASDAYQKYAQLNHGAFHRPPKDLMP